MTRVESPTWIIMRMIRVLIHLYLQARFNRPCIDMNSIIGHRGETQLRFGFFMLWIYLLNQIFVNDRWTNWIRGGSVFRARCDLVDLDWATACSRLDYCLLLGTFRLNLSLSATLPNSLNHGDNFLVFILLSFWFSLVYFKFEDAISRPCPGSIGAAANRPGGFVVHGALPLVRLSHLHLPIIRFDIRQIRVARFRWISPGVHRVSSVLIYW